MTPNLLLVANWKQNGSQDLLSRYQSLPSFKGTLVICPPAIFLNDLTPVSNITFGAQNVSAYQKGAYTGEIGADMLQLQKVEYCLVGHSERRTIFLEDDACISQKLQRLYEHSITPILCIGENIESYQEGTREQMVLSQLQKATDTVTALSKEQKIIVAYEPIWSIGTGNVPTTEEIIAIFEVIHNFFAKTHGAHVKILYGGSVNEDTIDALFTVKNLSGVLIGGASLKFDVMTAIINKIATQEE